MLSSRFEYGSEPIFLEKNFDKKVKADIERKIHEGIYEFEDIPCVVCGGENFELLSMRDHHGLLCPVVICEDCGLIQTNPRMTEKSLFEFYRTDYRRMYNDDVRREFASEYGEGRKIFSFMRQSNVVFPVSGIINFKYPKLRVLEVGCGGGGILKHFADKGCNVMGIDLDKEWVAFGQSRYDLNLSIGTIHDVEDKFDIIIYSHTFEHIANPRRELKQIRELLVEDGVIYISVPSPEALDHTYDMDFLKYVHFEHTFHFTLTTLRNLVESEGFRLLSGNRHVRSIFVKSDNFRRNFENEYSRIMEYLRALEKFRSKMYHPFPLRLYWYVPYPFRKAKHLPEVLFKKALTLIGVSPN